MKIDIAPKESEIIGRIVWQAIKNGNSANPTAFVPDPEEYKALCYILNKINQK